VKRCMLLGTVGVLVVGMTACGDDDDDDAADVQEANAEVCQNLVEYRDAVGAFVALDPSTATKSDYDSAADAVRSAREDLVGSAQDLAEAEWSNLASQIDTLRDQLQDAPDDQAVAAIVEDAQPQAAAVQASAATLNSAICTPTDATTGTSG
jgi:hypothetical protein